MVYEVYAMRDTRTEFLNPVCEPNKHSAVRHFAMAVEKTGTDMNFCPSDFDLYKIAFYDTESGVMDPVVPIEFVCNGGSLNEV